MRPRNEYLIRPGCASIARLWWIMGLAVLTCFSSVMGADMLRIEFAPVLQRQSMRLNQPMALGSYAAVSISRLDFLLSGLALRKKDGTWVESRDWFAFLSAASSQMKAEGTGTPEGDYTGIRFRIGVDETTHKMDPNLFAPDHPLNPQVNGLHWGWAGGYIFMAIEGHAESTGFSYHIANTPQLLTVELPVEFRGGRPLTLAVDFDVQRVFAGIDFAKDGTSTHSREGDPLAAKLKANLEKAFKVRSVSYDLFQSPALAQNATAAPQITQRFPQVKLPVDNPITAEGVELGRLLFNDKRLSVNSTQSCASCHEQSHAFADVRRFSLGAQQQSGKRNTMPLFNLAWHSAFFWDGRASSLREQVLMPIQDKAEMNETMPNVIAKLRADSGEAFRKAFGSSEITADRIAKALEQFLLTFISQDSKFDRAARKVTTLTESEKRGLQLFVTEFDPKRGLRGADCFHCHGGTLFTNNSFANNGLALVKDEVGRMAVTKNEADRGKFKVPSLRNIALTAPYMHDGRFATLEDVVEHYSSGVLRSETLDPNLAKHPEVGIQLSNAEKADLVAFLKTLSDETFTQKNAITAQR